MSEDMREILCALLVSAIVLVSYWSMYTFL